MRKGNRKKHFFKIVITFLTAFCVVMLAGFTALWGYYAIVGQEAGDGGQAAGAVQGGSQLFGELIPEEGEELVGQQAERGVGMADTWGEEEAAVSEPQEAGRYAEVIKDVAYMEENHIYVKDTARKGEVVLAFGGDILFDPNYSVMARLMLRGEGIQGGFSQDLLAEMRSADIMMLNNEFPYSDRGVPTEEKQFTFRARPDSVQFLHEMGVDIVSLANNHAFDYGEEGLLDTLDILKGAGIPCVGAGRNLAEAAAPAYFIAGDLKLAFVSATQIERLENPDTRGATDSLSGVFRCWNPDKLLEVVKEAEANSDFVVVYIHWGTENVAEPDVVQLDQAPRLIEAGADLIIGDHPHCLQPIEYIDGVPVFYSIGNLWFNSREMDTCLVKAVVDSSGLKSLQFLPALQKDCITVLLHGAEKERVLAYMRSISEGVAIDGEGYIR